MTDRDRIDLSVITVTPGGLGEIERTLAALRAQTARSRIELVVVAPSELPPDSPKLEGFASLRTVVDPLETLGSAITAGMLAASGPVVAYSEEHSQPEPAWAEALIERHEGPWVAVGWAIENANPGTTASWAHLLTDFGPGVAPVESGERDRPMSWHHVSYKRDELIARRERLSDLVEAEGILQQGLLDEGKRLFLEGKVSSRHLNISRPRENVRSHLFGGRGFGSARAEYEGWGPPRRLAYACAWPLVPVVRMSRLRADLARTRTVRGRTPGLIPALLINLVFDAIGEAIGYVAGEGRSRSQRLPMELQRERYLGTRDSAGELTAS